MPSLLPIGSLGCSWQAPPKAKLCLQFPWRQTSINPGTQTKANRGAGVRQNKQISWRTTTVELLVCHCLRHRSLAWHYRNLSGTQTGSHTFSDPWRTHQRPRPKEEGLNGKVNHKLRVRVWQCSTRKRGSWASLTWSGNNHSQYCLSSVTHTTHLSNQPNICNTLDL